MNFSVVGLGLLIIFKKARVGGLDGSRDNEGLLSPPLQILDQMVSQDRAECDGRQINGCSMLVNVNWMDIKTATMI